MDVLLVQPLLKPFLALLRAYQSSIQPLHGKVEFPPSRAYHLLRQGVLTEHQANELEGGKGFPVMYGHWIDPDAPDDVPGREPPRDGEIASGGKVDDNRKYLNYADKEPLNEPGVNVDTNWPKYRVDHNVPFRINWHHEARHKTRRWSYWLTQPGWDSSQRLRREHFGEAPIHVLTWHYQPYWGDKAEQELVAPTRMVHEFDLPERQGYHVLLAVWDVADTFSSFYQVIDLDFG